MSSTPTGSVTELPRRRPTAKQADMVRRIVDAATDEIKASGYAELTVRNVAARAGVAAATAYTYFASKDHLISEVFWRRLRELPAHVDRRRGLAARVGSALADLTGFLAAEPELAAAATSALLAADPDVKHVRDRVGAEIRRRIQAALGARDDDPVVQALDLAVGGAMIQAGMGHLPYGELPNRIADVAALLMRERR